MPLEDWHGQNGGGIRAATQREQPMRGEDLTSLSSELEWAVSAGRARGRLDRDRRMSRVGGQRSRVIAAWQVLLRLPTLSVTA